jgi:hypothetical protein
MCCFGIKLNCAVGWEGHWWFLLITLLL